MKIRALLELPSEEGELRLAERAAEQAGRYPTFALLRRADRADPERAVRNEPLPEKLAQRLLALPASHAVVYSVKPRVWWSIHARVRAYDVETRARTCLI